MSESTITKPQARDASGRLVAPDGLPGHGHARAFALAQAGKTRDPLARVSEQLIALHAPTRATAPVKQKEEK